MSKTQVDSVALAAAALAATLALTLLLGPFAWMGSIVGLVLLLVLFGFDQEGYRTVLGSLGFAAVCGLCFAVACGAILKLLAANGEVHLANEQWATEWLPVTCVFATAFLWAIDRSRMGARVSVGERLVSRPSTLQPTLIRSAEPAIPRTAPAISYSPVPEPQAAYSQPPMAQQPVFPNQTYADPTPTIVPSPSRTLQPQSILTPAAAPVITQPIMPPPTVSTPAEAPPSIARSGPDVTIYVSLIGEGINVMRTVIAEHVGRDYYRIVDTMPEGETWQFQPGQVVRCKKQTLSTGKALVAVEEAPRAQ